MLVQKFLGVKDHTGKPIDPAQTKELYRKTLSIAWPSTVEGALLSIISSVDTMMVGTLGAASIAAVGLTGQPRMIMLIFAQALCIGTTALCARRKGAQDSAGANACLNQSLVIITVIGVLMTLIGYFGAESPVMKQTARAWISTSPADKGTGGQMCEFTVHESQDF